MAIDTKNKRSSSTHLLMPGFPALAWPDGTIAQSDRQAATWVYTGITAYTVSPGTLMPEEDWMTVILIG